MDLMIKNYLDRARNEHLAAEILKKSSEEKGAKDYFSIKETATFYSSVISHSYYAIFYAAKAILLTKKIKTSFPNVHKKTLDMFKKNFVDSGILDKRLFEIYEEAVIRADELLEIFKDEKWKRGNFTYQTIPQANKVPAEESMKNANTFVSNIIKVIED